MLLSTLSLSIKRPHFQTSAWTLTVLSEVFNGVPPLPQTYDRTAHQVRPQTHPSTFFPVHCSLIIMPLKATWHKLLTVSLNKP